MWRLILPDCRTCDVRKASSWKDQRCHMCRAEEDLLIEQLEDMLGLESIDHD